MGQRGSVVHRVEILIQLGNVRHAGYHHGDIRVGADIAQRRHGVLDGAARQGLHGNEADVLFGAGVDQFFCLIFHDVVGEHDGLHPWQLQRHPEGFQRVGSDADMADLPGRLRRRQGFQRAAGGADLLQIRRGRVVNLVQVNIVGAEIFQADVNVLRHGLRRAGHALCGKHKMLPDALQTDP